MKTPFMTTFKLILFCCLFIFSASFFSAPAFSTPFLANPISFEIESAQAEQGQLDRQLIETLEHFDIFSKLESFVEQNLKLEKHISFIFRHQNTPYFQDETTRRPIEQSKTGQQLIVTFSLLYQLHHEISLRFPQQDDIRDKIFAAAIEKHLWLELGRFLISQYSLTPSGNEEYLLDSFSTLMLINLSDIDSEYILDATEAYLLTNNSRPRLIDDKFKSELENDEHRYRAVVCLILGKDLSIESQKTLKIAEPFADLLSDLSWGEKRLTECRQHYQQKLLAWYEALSPHLKKGNQLEKWLKFDSII